MSLPPSTENMGNNPIFVGADDQQLGHVLSAIPTLRATPAVVPFPANPHMRVPGHHHRRLQQGGAQPATPPASEPAPEPKRGEIPTTCGATRRWLPLTKTS